MLWIFLWWKAIRPSKFRKLFLNTEHRWLKDLRKYCSPTISKKEIFSVQLVVKWSPETCRAIIPYRSTGNFRWCPFSGLHFCHSPKSMGGKMFKWLAQFSRKGEKRSFICSFGQWGKLKLSSKLLLDIWVYYFKSSSIKSSSKSLNSTLPISHHSRNSSKDQMELIIFIYIVSRCFKANIKILNSWNVEPLQNSTLLRKWRKV